MSGPIRTPEEALEAAAQDGPRIITKRICSGCKHLRTEYWQEELENDYIDSGTNAWCMALGGKGRRFDVTGYWHPSDPTPDWCPRIAPPALSPLEEIGEAALRAYLADAAWWENRTPENNEASVSADQALDAIIDAELARRAYEEAADTILSSGGLTAEDQP